MLSYAPFKEKIYYHHVGIYSFTFQSLKKFVSLNQSPNELSQKLAQNERTLFSFLGSSEQNGFQDLLHQIEVGEFILPHNMLL